MPDADPQPADVYKASPATSIDGDAHGDRYRPVAVVERLPRTATCLTRTTHPESRAETLESEKNVEIGLTEDGWWTNRHQRSVPRRFWGTKDFVYSGRLPESEAAALARFWELLGMLGRRNA
ncbi:hypothetical protein ABZX12_03830 [Kribbella sp. NPDC003505]|uniref:hypothetical protein n=1 Tax=Kribbella sp. NPDC003505 TaxID=3154448 RepID=UPI0033A491E6